MNVPRHLLVYALMTDGADRHPVTLRGLGGFAGGPVEALLIGHTGQGDLLRAAAGACRDAGVPFHLIVNPVANGPGADHKLALQFAVDQGFSIVVPLDRTEVWTAETLAEVSEPIARSEADAVFASRPAERRKDSNGARARGGWRDRALARLQDRLIGVRLSELRPRCRAYSVGAVARVRFELATDQAHFDTELLIQLRYSGARLLEIAAPGQPRGSGPVTGGAGATWRACRSLFRAWLCDRDLFYDRRFDPTTALTHDVYRLKIAFDSSHRAALARVRDGSTILDLGCGNPSLSRHFVERRSCRVTGIDRRPVVDTQSLHAFHVHDLNRWPLPVAPGDFDYVLLLDVLEHLASPEGFLDNLRDALNSRPHTRLLVSVPNVAFFVERIMLLFGRFNYGRRGILDLTHTRLFTASSIRRLFEQSGFVVEEVVGVPPPYPLAIGHNAASRLLLRVNRFLIRLSLGLFSYQVLLVARTSPSPRYLLDRAARDAPEREEVSTAAG